GRDHGGADPRLRRCEREAEREGRGANAGVPADDDEVLAAESAAQVAVEGGKAGRDPGCHALPPCCRSWSSRAIIATASPAPGPRDSWTGATSCDRATRAERGVPSPRWVSAVVS